MRKTPIRSCEPRVVRWRLIASFARVTAVEKPMQYSVPWTSLSIVLDRDDLDAGVREHLRVRERVVPADRDQRVDAQALQVLEHDRREVVDPVARLERREPVGADEGGQVPG